MRPTQRLVKANRDTRRSNKSRAVGVIDTRNCEVLFPESRDAIPRVVRISQQKAFTIFGALCRNCPSVRPHITQFHVGECLGQTGCRAQSGYVYISRVGSAGRGRLKRECLCRWRCSNDGACDARQGVDQSHILRHELIRCDRPHPVGLITPRAVIPLLLSDILVKAGRVTLYPLPNIGCLLV